MWFTLFKKSGIKSHLKQAESKMYQNGDQYFEFDALNDLQSSVVAIIEKLVHNIGDSIVNFKQYVADIDMEINFQKIRSTAQKIQKILKQK